ncbi:MAG: 5'-3' exonuclease H3TH domain-containing protein [Pseudohongiella sp.]|nr:5'-3' exonuclease H3TH domain-containing protein [Pseudohongiella sp.]
MPPLYLIDASIYIFQAHFSPHTQVWSRRAEDRSAFVGFLRFLIRFLQSTQVRESAPVAVAFDESLQSGFRHRLYPAYKSNRVLPDENLARQLKACADVCELLGVRGFGSQEYEADDIIGTISHTCRQSAVTRPIVIVSRDKDLSQLLTNDHDELWDFYAASRRNRDNIKQVLGIWPEQFPCYLGLTGDAIDCIPGIPGIGPVAARQLLSHFGNLESVFEQVDQVHGLKMRGAKRCAQLLAEHQVMAMLSRQLATIARQAPATEAFAVVSENELELTAIDAPALLALLREMDLSEDDVQRFVFQLETLDRLLKKKHS